MLKDDEAVDWARNTAKQTMSKAWKQIDSILPDSDAKDDLHTLTKFLLNRTI